MKNFAITADFYRLFETVRIPFVVTDSDLNIIYANKYAQESLPFILEIGNRLEIDDFLENEDTSKLENVVSECKEQGESIGTLKEKETNRCFKVRAYYMRSGSGEIVFHFEDASQSRAIEDQYYDHLIDLYNQIENQEREIADLRAKIFPSGEFITKL
ncbi:MAG: PAS domain-containing protein [Candidatus Kryptoniota bacterium]